MALFLASVSVAHAQSAAPTVSAVVVTSNPGDDGGYAIGETIEVTLTFSEAVTVVGTPGITLDIGGAYGAAEYSGAGTTPGQLRFSYTVAAGDEDRDGIAVVANSLALNGGAIRAGATSATLTHAALQANDHKVDGVAPTVTVGGETRTYVPPDRQFNVVFYFSEKVYGITDSEITVTNGAAHDVRAPYGNDTWPRYTKWDVVVLPAAEGPVTVTLQAGAATDAYGNGNAAPGGALSVIAADPVTVEVARTTSGFAEGGKAEFTVTRSRDNGGIPVSLQLDQTGDFLSGIIEVFPPPDPANPGDPATPQEVAFSGTPFTLNVTFAAGETSKRIAVLTEDDGRDEANGTVTLSIPAKTDQYKYIPGFAASATSTVRDNDEPFQILLTSDSYTPLSPLIEGEIAKYLLVHSGNPSVSTAYLQFTEGLELLDLDGAGSRGYEHVAGGRISVELRGRRTTFSVPTLEDETIGPGGRITLVGKPGDGYFFSEHWIDWTYRLSDDDSPPSVTLVAPAEVTEGNEVRYALSRTAAAGQSREELIVNVLLEQTGDYISWPEDYEPDTNGRYTIPVTFGANRQRAVLTLTTDDDDDSETNGEITAQLLASSNNEYTLATTTPQETVLIDDEAPQVSVEAVAARVTEGTDAQYRITRTGDASGSLRVGLYVTGMPKIMTDATKAIALTSDNEDQSQRLFLHGTWVDYILEFAAGETERVLSLTTEADSVNEGDGWLAVSILQRTSVPYSIGTGRVRVHVEDDDIPTVSLTMPVGPTDLELSADGTTWVGTIPEATEFTYSSTCTGVTQFAGVPGSEMNPAALWVLYSNHPAFYGSVAQERWLGNNFARLNYMGADCDGRAITQDVRQVHVGPANGVLEITLVPLSEFRVTKSGTDLYLWRVIELLQQYRQAAMNAEAEGRLITEQNIFHPIQTGGRYWTGYCKAENLPYCPRYRVGTVNKIRLTITNRDPSILIKAESPSVIEGQPARFILERGWATDLLELPAPQSETVVYLRASQDGQYITGALPTRITFGQNETRKVIELQTVDDAAFGETGSVTIELLPDSSEGSVNLQGKYTTWANWLGHTPTGGRSDQATVTIANNDDKPGITIAPAWAVEGDTSSAGMTFTVSLGTTINKPVQVSWATSDGAATAGQDYTAVTGGVVTIPANSTSATFTVSVTDDTTDEPDETFNVTISLQEPDLTDGSGSAPPEVAIVGGDTATVLGTIVDDDPVVVTILPKEDSVTEGQDAAFFLTRTGYTDEELSVRVLLRTPGGVKTLSAEFDADAAAAQLSVKTVDNDLVDYPSARDYTIEVLGDGDISGEDDEIYTPGDPGAATVTVTDNDRLQIMTVHAVDPFPSKGEGASYIFRRTGDISQPLAFRYYRGQRHALGPIPYNTEYFPHTRSVFEANQAELIITTGTLREDPDWDRYYPWIYKIRIYGDGELYGLDRVWKAGIPNTAMVIYYDDDGPGGLYLQAEYPHSGQVGQTIHMDFSVLNAGSKDTGDNIAVSSVQRESGDNYRTAPPEPRVACNISGPLAPGQTGACRASFILTEQDLTDSPLILDASAREGTATSNRVNMQLRVLRGVAVGFTETDRLSVTEPVSGEANARAVLPVNRVGELGEEIQVAYTIEPIRTQNRPYPPVEGADYVDNSATPGVLTFAANQTAKNITIDILGDEIDENRELFRVTLVPPGSVLVEAARRDRVVVIVDNAPPSGSYRPTASIELVSPDPIPESAGSADFAVVLDRVWGKHAQFEVSLDAHNNLTATPANARLGRTGDFEPPNGLIHATIPAGETRFEFSLTLLDDDVREDDETFQMLLSSSVSLYHGLIGDDYKALVTITDDDLVAPTGVELTLTRNNRAFDSVAEDSSQRNIAVTASFSDIRWPTDGPGAPLRPADPRNVDTIVRVTFDGPNSTAILTDIERFQVEDSQGTFQEVEYFDIVIPAGRTSGTTTLRFKPADDDIDEEDETVTLQGTELVAADSDEFLPVSSASFTITDDDIRGITITTSIVANSRAIFMDEGETFTYALVLDSQPTDPVTIAPARRNTDDFISLQPASLTFTPPNWSIPQEVVVTALEDGSKDPSYTNAYITHQVSGGDYASETVNDIYVTIKDTTHAYIYLEDAQALESDGHIEFKVSVQPVLPLRTIHVRYATVDGAAVAGTDYTREVDTGETFKLFTIPSNRGMATIRIPITDDQVYEAAEKTFTLQLSHNSRANFAGDATSLTATGTIIDDDPKPVVSVAGPAGDLSYISEDATGPVTFTLTLTGRSATDVTVDYATGAAQLLSAFTSRQGITRATAGEDYTAATGSVTFSPGETTKQVTVQLTNDDMSEDTEFFGFKISNARNAQLPNEATEQVADVGLLDDDPRGVLIEAISIGLEEPASGETAVASSYTVRLKSTPTDAVTVTIGGGSDSVVTLSATTLTFNADNWATAQRVTVTPLKDANAMGETITLTHTLSGGDYTGIPADSVTINVTDSDTRNIVLSPTSLTVTEGEAAGTSYTVKLATEPSNTVTVTLSGHSGTALLISGMTLSIDQMTFTSDNWATAQTVTVKAAHDDNAVGESETLVHTASGGDYAIVTADLPITVNDDAPTTVTAQFGAASYTVAESDDTGTTEVTENTVEVTVTLSADPERTVVIPIETANQGGASAADYSGVPQTVTFNAGDTSRTFTFEATQDEVDDDDESVLLSFGASLPADVTAGTPAASIVSITDDDAPSITVSFGAASYTVAESDDTGTTEVTENTVEVTVTLSADPERTVVIPIETANQGGASAADYSGVPQSVTFTSGDTSMTFTIAAEADDVNDDGESVRLSFGASLPADVTAGTPATSTVTITDDDAPSITVSFGSATYTVAESDDTGTANVTENTVEVTVALSAEPERTVVIPIETANLEGASAADYSGVPPTVTFTSGDTSMSFTFEATQDEVDDDGESVLAELRREPARRRHRRDAGRDHRHHHRRRRARGDGQLRGRASYTVAEGSSRTVTVELSADPERTVVIPIETTDQGGAAAARLLGRAGERHLRPAATPPGPSPSRPHRTSWTTTARASG